MWSLLSRTSRGRVSRFGTLTGLTDLQPRRTFELRPYLLARTSATATSGSSLFGAGGPVDWDYAANVGLDAKVGLSSRLTLDLTINPDFGQVEADEVVLNLTRFETFFPEKRQFFLEGFDIFSTPLVLFYSRRIGEPTAGLEQGSPLCRGLLVQLACPQLALAAAHRDEEHGGTVGNLSNPDRRENERSQYDHHDDKCESTDKPAAATE
jgi:hypothetical protein